MGGVTGFPEAINNIYPQTEVQLCVIHQISNSIKYVASNDHKAFMADLKPVYRAGSKEAAETVLDELEAKWDQAVSSVAQSRDDASGKICQHTIEFKKHGVSKILYVKSDAES